MPKDLEAILQRIEDHRNEQDFRLQQVYDDNWRGVEDIDAWTKVGYNHDGISEVDRARMLDIGGIVCGDCAQVIPCQHAGIDENGKGYTIGH